MNSYAIRRRRRTLARIIFVVVFLGIVPMLAAWMAWAATPEPTPKPHCNFAGPVSLCWEPTKCVSGGSRTAGPTGMAAVDVPEGMEEIHAALERIAARLWELERAESLLIASKDCHDQLPQNCPPGECYWISGCIDEQGRCGCWVQWCC